MYTATDMPDQRGMKLVDIMGNHYLFCNTYDAAWEVTPTQLGYVTAPLNARQFLFDLKYDNSLDSTLREIYSYGRPHFS